VTENANPTLGKIEDLFKSLVWDNLITVGLAALFQAAPFLAWWPCRPILDYVIRMFGDHLFATLKLTIDLQAIAFVNETHRRAFDSAAVHLKIIGRDKGPDSEEFRKAKENAKEALAKFVRFNGS
jgi:hypothetical protein